MGVYEYLQQFSHGFSLISHPYTRMIRINLDVMLAKRKMSVTELTEKVGITMANISILKNGKARAIRFSTLEAICKALDCQPGDILEFKE